MELLARRRAARAFRVEQPSLASLPEALRTEAMNDVPALVRAIDTLNRVEPRAGSTARYSLLGEQFAIRTATLGTRRPAIGQVTVSLRGQKAIPAWAMNDETPGRGLRARRSDRTRRAAWPG